MASAFVLRVGHLFDGTEAPSRRDVFVSVTDGRIAAIGDRSALETAPVIEALDATLLPGLIDCHVHFTLSGSPHWLEEGNEPLPITAWKAAGFARQTLEAGFTTVRTLGGRHFLDIHLRDAIDAALIPGPRVVAAGLAICMTGGHARWIGREADGPDEVRKATREQLRAGADVVKFIATGGVMTPGVEPGSAQLTLEELQAGVEEAHKAGRSTAAHAQGVNGIRNAVQAGIDSVEHGFHLDAHVVAEMKARGTFLVPTLVAPECMVHAGPEGGIPDWAVRKASQAWDAHQESFSLAVNAGVKIAFGTDAGTPLNYHGKNARELELMVGLGMSPQAALRAATSQAAELLGIAQDVGSIQPGKRADLLLVRGDPLEDVTLLQQSDQILAVYKGGERVGGTL